MLRECVGEATSGGILRNFYERHRLQHVTGDDFQRVAEEASGRDLDWFFDAVDPEDGHAGLRHRRRDDASRRAAAGARGWR